MATEFINTLKSTGGDFTLMSTWESATQCDLTAATIKVFAHGGITGVIANDATVTGQTSSATGTVVGVTTAGQILIDGISGTFSSGEVVQVSAGNSVTISDAGDSPLAVLECYKGTTTNGGWQSDGTLRDQLFLDGWTTAIGNGITVRAAAGNGHEGVIGDGFTLVYNQPQATLNHNVQYTTYSGISFANSINYGGATTCYVAAGNSKFENIIGTCANVNAVFVHIVSDLVEYINCIAHDSPNGFSATSYDVARYYNCGAFNCSSSGFDDQATISPDIEFINCVAAGNAIDFKSAGSTTGSNCASSDGTSVSTGVGTITGVVLTDGVDFVSPSTDDYTPTSTGKLAGAGTNLSYLFVDDITGTPRTDAALFGNDDIVTMRNGDIVHYKD